MTKKQRQLAEVTERIEKVIRVCSNSTHQAATEEVKRLLKDYMITAYNYDSEIDILLMDLEVY